MIEFQGPAIERPCAKCAGNTGSNASGHTFRHSRHVRGVQPGPRDQAEPGFDMKPQIKARKTEEQKKDRKKYRRRVASCLLHLLFLSLFRVFVYFCLILCLTPCAGTSKPLRYSRVSMRVRFLVVDEHLVLPGRRSACGRRGI